MNETERGEKHFIFPAILLCGILMSFFVQFSMGSFCFVFCFALFVALLFLLCFALFLFDLIQFYIFKNEKLKCLKLFHLIKIF